MKKKETKKARYNMEIAIYGILGVVTAVVLLITAYNNSPLCERIGEDGGIYLLMGRNMIEGGTLYKDLFDHKGPLIFVLNALPQLFIKGPLGVWILEVVFAFFSCISLYKTGCRLANKKTAVFPPILYLGALGLIYCGGNYTEEFCNLFSILTIDIFVKWDKNNKELTNIEACLLWVYFALIFFMRPNNASIVVGAIGYIGIYSILKNRKKLIKYIGFGTIGLSIVSVPIIIFHYVQGTLYDMFYATILHNLNYCIEGQKSNNMIMRFTDFKGWMLLIFTIVAYAIIKGIKHKDKTMTVFLGTSSILSVICILASGREYMHYIVIALPLFCLSLIILLSYGIPNINKLIANQKKLYTAIFILTLGVLLIDLFEVKIYKISSSVKRYKDDCVELFQNIPENEQGTIFGYDIPAMWFYCNDVYPDYRYFTMQTWMSKTNPEINEDILDYLNEEKPKWIVTYMEDAGINFEVREIIIEEYEKVGENSSGYLYKRK